jgi:hypothetical protein
MIPFCLQALAGSREWQLLEKQLATVKGYKLLRTCQMVLRHTQAVLRLLPPAFWAQVPGMAEALPECKARQLLASMCEERLMPTHWLNQVRANSPYMMGSVIDGCWPTAT